MHRMKAETPPLSTLGRNSSTELCNASEELVRVCGVSKAFGGVQALSDVNLEIRKGEIHALCGENGAGKSTLIKILGGIYAPDQGKVDIDGQELSPSVAAAAELGVSVIHQELVVCPHLNAIDNIFLGREVQHRSNFFLDWNEMASQARSLIELLGEHIDLNVPVGTLSVAQRQLIGMARALSQNSRLLILDEPTASLSAQEVDALFRIIRRLRQEGVSILYVSHRMEEIFALADRGTVLRDGKHIKTFPMEGMTVEAIVELMVGREIKPFATESVNASGTSEKTVLEVKNLSSNSEFEDISFVVREGEIVGLAGLVGAGRSEVANAIFGVAARDAGEVLIDGKPLKARSIATSIRHGIAMVPEDRQHQGLVLPMSVSENLSLVVLQSLVKWGLIQKQAERVLTDRLTDELRVKSARPSLAAGALSGGNQQKLVLGKWLATKPRLLILDEPTRGVDVAAKAEIHRRIREIASQGIAVLLISSELPEILRLSDRILVMREGQIATELSVEQATEQKILAFALPKKIEASETTRSLHVRSTKASSWSQFAQMRETWLLALLLLTMGYVGYSKPTFLAPANLLDVAAEAAPTMILACAMTLVIVTAEIDISIGSIIGLTGAVLGICCYGPEPLMPVALGAVCAVLVATLMGIINGMLVTWGRVPSIIATLGMLTVLRGATKLVMGGSSIDGRPDSLRTLATGKLLGLPLSIWAAIVVASSVFILIHYTPLGRRIYAVGSNGKAAPLLGISVHRTKFFVFAFSGFMAGLATLLLAPKNAIIQPNLGEGLELLVVTCVVVGGTSIQGGRGRITGTLLAVILLTLVPTALTFIGAPPQWRMAIQGAFILTAVLADHFTLKAQRQGAYA